MKKKFVTTLLVTLLVGLLSVLSQVYNTYAPVSKDTETVSRPNTSSPKPEVRPEPPKASSDSIETFSEAKDVLHKKIFTETLRVDLYCSCPYSADKVIDLAACGVTPRANAARAKRLEWEHVVPASHYGRSLTCWASGGRKNCASTSTYFKDFEGDLHNLRPSVGEVNGDRSDLPYGRVSKRTNSKYGSCDFRIGVDVNDRAVAEPADKVKGDVARVSLYMADKYRMPLSSTDRDMFLKWDKLDPVSEQEKTINKLIKEFQGDGNTYIAKD